MSEVDSDCPRCSEDGVIICIEDPQGDSFTTVVPWAIIEEVIAEHVKSALDANIEAMVEAAAIEESEEDADS
jgi:hypothetical protein